MDPILAVTAQSVLLTALAVVGAFCAVNVLIFFIPHLHIRPDGGGDPAKGLVIWVEPLRFMGIHWGERSVPAGLRRAGFAGEFRYWGWHSGWSGTLLLPALRNPRLIERRAAELADFIARTRAEHPDRPIYLMGYSAGGFVAMRALELLPKGTQVDSAAALSAAFSPWRDLTPATEHVRGRLLVSSSLGDCWVCGVGTLLFGNADGRHAPGISMLGYRGPAHSRIVQARWHPGMIRRGLLGMHDWSMLPDFIAHEAVTLLDIARA